MCLNWDRYKKSISRECPGIKEGGVRAYETVLVVSNISSFSRTIHCNADNDWICSVYRLDGQLRSQ
jgi:hypothetical protein